MPTARPNRLTHACESLRTFIAAQGFAADFPLPSFRSLAVNLNVGLTTLHRACLELEKEGLLRRLGPRTLVIAAPAGMPRAKRSSIVQKSILIIAPINTSALTADDEEVAGFPHLVLSSIISRCSELAIPTILERLDSPRIATYINQAPRGVIVPFNAAEFPSVCAAIGEFRRLKIPVVIGEDELPEHALDSELAELSDCDLVRVDHRQGRSDLVSWLFARRRVRPLLILPPASRNPRMRWLSAQITGHRETIKRLGMVDLPPLALPAISETPGPEHDELWTRLLAGCLVDRMHGSNPPDAILAFTDGLIPPLVKALRLIGHEPGPNLPILGYDGYFWRNPWMRTWRIGLGYEPLVSMNLPAHALGIAAVDLILDRLAGRLENRPQRRKVPMELLFPPRQA